MDDLPRLQFDDEESKERTEEKVRDLQEIADPHLCCMIAQECFDLLVCAFDLCFQNIQKSSRCQHRSVSGLKDDQLVS